MAWSSVHFRARERTRSAFIFPDGDHIKHAILDKQGKKGKGLHPNAKIFTFSGACLCKTHCFLDGCLLVRVKRTLLLNTQYKRQREKFIVKKYSGNVSGIIGLLITKFLELPKSAFMYF